MSRDPVLDKLKKEIQEAKKAAHPTPLKQDNSQNLAGKFFNVGIELVAGVLVGVGIGLFIDWTFETSPWGLIIFFLFGAAAGMYNVIRVLSVKEKPPPKSKTDIHD